MAALLNRTFYRNPSNHKTIIAATGTPRSHRIRPRIMSSIPRMIERERHAIGAAALPLLQTMGFPAGFAPMMDST